jgi:shikimate dehydrogenase
MKVYCILGDERALRSKSPAIFSAVIQKLGIKGAYVPFSVAPGNIGKALESMRILNIDGANVTVPYKEVVVPHLDVLSEGANVIGAINTIVRNGDVLKGYNTNAIGLMDALTDAGFDVENKSALVFGTGGAARAVVFVFNWLRTHSIMVAGRNESKTLQMVSRFGGEAKTYGALSEQPIDVDLIVNATSISSSDESIEMAALLERIGVRNCELVLDLNYGRRQNIWQDMAKRNNIRFLDGLTTLAYQARRTFALWTGLQVPPEEFLKVIQT